MVVKQILCASFARSATDDETLEGVDETAGGGGEAGPGATSLFKQILQDFGPDVGSLVRSSCPYLSRQAVRSKEPRRSVIIQF